MIRNCYILFQSSESKDIHSKKTTLHFHWRSCGIVCYRPRYMLAVLSHSWGLPYRFLLWYVLGGKIVLAAPMMSSLAAWPDVANGIWAETTRATFQLRFHSRYCGFIIILFSLCHDNMLYQRGVTPLAWIPEQWRSMEQKLVYRWQNVWGRNISL